MRVLLVGRGGREHALAWKLAPARRARGARARRATPASSERRALRAGRRRRRSPSWPQLAESRARRSRRRRARGAARAPGSPTRCAAAGLPCSAARAPPPRSRARRPSPRSCMARHCGPDGGVRRVFAGCREADAVRRRAARGRERVVIKADGLAAGKGVVVAAAPPRPSARRARACSTARPFGDAGARVVVEERLVGREVSMMALVDGERLALLRPRRGSQGGSRRRPRAEHRRHGRLSPSPVVTTSSVARAVARGARARRCAALAAEGRPFRGLLYAGPDADAQRGRA